jgi:hypothetical protein
MKKTVLFGLPVMVLAFGLAFAGCDDGSDPFNNGPDNNGPVVPNPGDGTDPTNNGNSELPKSVGANAVGGKTYFDDDWGDNIVFSVTADGAENGTYTGRTVASGIYDPNIKFDYIDIETGTYTWNEGAKTITLKPEKVAFNQGSSGNGSSDGDIEIEANYGPLNNKTAYRSDAQAMYDAYRQEMGDEAFNQQLLSMGFSSLAAYLDYEVNEVFGNKTFAYSFSDDGTALFLERVLKNNGTNELSGQTYYGMMEDYVDGEEIHIKDEYQEYVFTATSYTYTSSRYYRQTITGSYFYNSSMKRVWLMPETIDGEDRAAYYATITVPGGHHFPDDNAYRAAETNSEFSFRSYPYNKTEKIIGSW